MKIRTFWIIFIKIVGIWLVLSALTLIPQFISLFTYLSDYFTGTNLAFVFVVILMLLVFVVYFLLLKLILFNTGWIIDKLRLDKDIEEESIGMSVAMKTVLIIATIVTGGLILVDAVPMLCQAIFGAMQRKMVFKQDPEFRWIIFYSIKTLIGYLLVTNSKAIVGFILRKSEKPLEVEEDEGESSEEKNGSMIKNSSS